jgi:hypothetical protein
MPSEPTTPDLPDRTAEIYDDDNGTPTVGRVYRDGAAITMSVDKDGNVRPQLRKLRTWFVGKDGLTSVERELSRFRVTTSKLEIIRLTPEQKAELTVSEKDTPA